MKRLNRYLALVAAVLALISCQSEKNSYDLIPYPNHIEQIPGRFSFDKGTQIFVSPECGDEVTGVLQQFADQFQKTSGMELKFADEERNNAIVVKANPDLADEAYRLNIGKSKIEIAAATPNGVRFALQTVK